MLMWLLSVAVQQDLHSNWLAIVLARARVQGFTTIRLSTVTSQVVAVFAD